MLSWVKKWFAPPRDNATGSAGWPDDASSVPADIAADNDDAAAEERYRKILAADPAHEAAYLDWCQLLFRDNRIEEATQLIERGLYQLPDSVHLHLYLGNLLHVRGNFAEAAAAYGNAATRLPDNAAILANLGLAQFMAQRHELAVATLQRALALDPDSIDANLTLGRAWLDLGRLDASRACFLRALELDPDHLVARYNLGHLALLSGDFEAGWAGFALRDRQPGMTPNPILPQPLFSLDADVSGKTVLLVAEQGYGDTLQFIRYAALVAARGARVIAAVPPSLQSLVARCTGVAAIVAPGTTPAFDFYSPLLALPGIFGTDLDSIPRATPYLHAAPERIAHWRRALGPTALPRIGLVWSGAPHKDIPVANHRDAMRSIPLSLWQALVQIDGAEFHSLQVGPAAVAQLSGTPQVADHAAALFDFQETAALIAQLDLVISVDTSVSHLAGALGKPVWLLNRYNSCWRWLLERSDSPWYPGMRIFRQDTYGDWQTVMADATQALSGFVSEFQRQQEQQQ